MRFWVVRMDEVEQLKQDIAALEARKHELEEANSLKLKKLGFDDVVKCTVMLADIGEWAAFNTVWSEFFTDRPMPARSAFGCAGLALGARVEIECTAAR